MALAPEDRDREVPVSAAQGLAVQVVAAPRVTVIGAVDPTRDVAIAVQIEAARLVGKMITMVSAAAPDGDAVVTIGRPTFDEAISRETNSAADLGGLPAAAAVSTGLRSVLLVASAVQDSARQALADQDLATGKPDLLVGLAGLIHAVRGNEIAMTTMMMMTTMMTTVVLVGLVGRYQSTIRSREHRPCYSSWACVAARRPGSLPRPGGELVSSRQ